MIMYHLPPSKTPSHLSFASNHVFVWRWIRLSNRKIQACLRFPLPTSNRRESLQDEGRISNMLQNFMMQGPVQTPLSCTKIGLSLQPSPSLVISAPYFKTLCTQETSNLFFVPLAICAKNFCCASAHQVRTYAQNPV